VTALGAGVARVELPDGVPVVVKAGDPAAEAAGLRWIAIPGGPPVPEVLEVGPDSMVITYVPPALPDRSAAADLGRRLATLHAAGAPGFGSPPPGGPRAATIGAAPMVNEPAPQWAPWYAADRVLPYLRTARDAGAIAPSDAAVVERACGRLPRLDEPPARLHGDLWSGNVLWSTDAAWLIDPAAHGGHRETDLAMLALFGCPHLDAVLGAYDEAAPLADGWRERVPCHQLFPLLVHAVLFGGGYGAHAAAAARRI
jgi:fructosamine-3-kinase